MSATLTPPSAATPGAGAPRVATPAAWAARKNRIRYSALALLAVALAFYVGFIALLVIRSHH
jgi:hypothetical protein